MLPCPTAAATSVGDSCTASAARRRASWLSAPSMPANSWVAAAWCRASHVCSTKAGATQASRARCTQQLVKSITNTIRCHSAIQVGASLLLAARRSVHIRPHAPLAEPSGGGLPSGPVLQGDLHGGAQSMGLRGPCVTAVFREGPGCKLPAAGNAARHGALDSMLAGNAGRQRTSRAKGHGERKYQQCNSMEEEDMEGQLSASRCACM